jgi:universal stress protein E
VNKAAQLARAFGAHLELFHGISTPLYIDPYPYADGDSIPQIERRMRSECVDQLEAIASRLRAEGLKVDVSATWDFPVYEAVVRRAARDRSDLIVAERHAKPHIAPGLLQLTDRELLRTSPVPVLLVKTKTPYRRPVVLAAVDPAHTLSKPAALDREILLVAKSVSKAMRGPLHAVNAYAPFPTQPSPRRLSGDESVKRLVRETESAARGSFLKLAQQVKIPEANCHLVGRHPIDAIEQTARRTHSSLVVMGAVSRSGLKRFFFGNTAEALLDSLDCDMLVVKPPEFAPRVQKRIRGVRFAAAPYIPGF